MDKSLIITFIIICNIGAVAFNYLSNGDVTNNSNSNANENNSINNVMQSEVNDMTNNINESNVNDSISKINLTINNETFTATLDSSVSVSEFLNLLPLEIKMNELNGNEKYYYLDESLTTNSSSYKTIENGDIMLYGSNCLVLFYETHNSSYSYTRLGKVDDPSRLKGVLGSGNPLVKIDVAN